MRRLAKASPAAPTSSTGKGRGRLRGALALVSAMLLALALAASASAATPIHHFEFSFGPDGTDATSFVTPQSVGVDQSNGDVYVIDQGGGSIYRFDEAGIPAPFSASGSVPYAEGNKLTGNEEGPFAFGPFGRSQVVIDSSGTSTDGNIYVAGSGSVAIFAPSGEFLAHLATHSGEGSWGAAVDNRNGDLYVSSGSAIDKFLPTGALPVEADYASSIAAGASQIAVDSQGNLYATTGFPGPIAEFDPSGAEVKTIGLGSNQTLCGLAVNPVTDHVLGVEDPVGFSFSGCGALSEHDSAGALLNTLTLRGRSFGAAVSGSSADVYVSNMGAGKVDVYGPAVDLPTSTGAATNVSANAGSATLNGTVNPSGSALTECVFQYGPTSAYGQTAPCAETPAQIGSGAAPVAVHADVSGLSPGVHHFRLVAANAIGPVRGADATFGISSVETLTATEVTTGGARLQAKILPAGVRTTYQFEYGTGTSYGSLSPAQPATAGSEGEPLVFRSIAGLAPGTTYHYRVVGEIPGERLLGADRTFTTPVVNPAGRAYEQVSPVDKEGVGVDDHFYPWQSSPSGDSLVYLGNAAFGDAPSSLWTGNWFRADRSGGGWSSKALTVPQENTYESPSSSGVMSSSEDLSHTVVVSNLALTPGAVRGNHNYYLRDNETGHLEFIYAGPRGGALDSAFVPGTASYDHLVFNGQAESNIYEFTDGHLSMVNRLPNGEAIEGTLLSVATDESQVISRDGSRIFFTEGNNLVSSGLYMREHGTTTVPISVSQKSGEVGEVKPATFAGASADGSVVFFVSDFALTDESKAHGESSDTELYRYDIDTGELTGVGEDSNGKASGLFSKFGGKVSVSKDGSYAYFAANRALTPDATEGNSFNYNFNYYVWHAGNVRLLAKGPELIFGQAPSPIWISPNGKFATILSINSFTGPGEGGNPSCSGAGAGVGHPEGFCDQVFVYDYDADELSCASCPPSGGTAAGRADLGVGVGPNGGHPARVVVDSGSVFFDTPTRLDPKDSNGVVDVYEWRNGETHLISAGTSASPSRLMDSSLSGDDVFFVTTDRLVGQDTDNAPDAYDARRDGGIAAQNPAKAPPPCSGEDCQPASAQTSPRVPGTAQGGGGALARRPSACKGIAGRARQAQSSARKLKQKAAKHSGEQRQALKQRGKAEAKKAAQLQRKAKNCQGGAA